MNVGLTPQIFEEQGVIDLMTGKLEIGVSFDFFTGRKSPLSMQEAEVLLGRENPLTIELKKQYPDSLHVYWGSSKIEADVAIADGEHLLIKSQDKNAGNSFMFRQPAVYGFWMRRFNLIKELGEGEMFKVSKTHNL